MVWGGWGAGACGRGDKEQMGGGQWGGGDKENQYGPLS